jgi:hypothetical protein
MWQGYNPTRGNDDVVGVDWTAKWHMWANLVSKRGILLTNGMVPRGPDMGYHVAH